jgi:hypothetical protein
LGIIVFLIAILSGKRNPLENDKNIGLALLRVVIGFAISIALTYYASLALGIFKISPIESRGYDAIPELIGVLALLLFKWLVFVLLPAILLSIFLAQIGSLIVRVILYFAFGAVAAGSWYTHQQQVKQIAAAEAQEAQAAQRLRDYEAQSRAMAEQARIDSNQREVERRKNLVDRIVELDAEVRKRWRADIEAAGAVGEHGASPPFIEVWNNSKQGPTVTNLMRGTVCIQIVRIHQPPGSQQIERCSLDVGTSCRSLYNARSMPLFPQGQNGTPACNSKHLEYRIGAPFGEGVSWWSRSALEDLDRTPPEPRESYTRLPEMNQLGEIAHREKMLADTDRAARWREQIAQSTR